MKKVFFADRSLLFCTAAEHESLPAREQAIAFDFATVRQGEFRLLERTNLLKIFETAKSIHCLCDTPAQADELFERLARNFTRIDAAGGVVRSPRGELLMIFRNGRWDLPKGKREEGESMAECALREVEEECGISRPTLGPLLGSTYHTYLLDQTPVLKQTAWFAMGHPADQTPTPQLEEGITEIRWVDPTVLADYLKNSYPSIRDILTRD